MKENLTTGNLDYLSAGCAERFKKTVFTDAQTGLSVACNIFLPKNYSAGKAYPAVVFIADASCVSKPSASLTQGLGALVWASDGWQSLHETVVIVPEYNVIVLDDHNGYVQTEYVELTKRLIDSVTECYAVDKNRVYATGQSMGCMIHLVLASRYPGLYSACMLVDGQWDSASLRGLEGQRFVYFAAEDDQRAFNGMSALMRQFDSDAAEYAYRRWDGGCSPEDLSNAAAELFGSGMNSNFISWKSGTVNPAQAKKRNVHMASFDLAYRCTAFMEWLFSG